MALRPRIALPLIVAVAMLSLAGQAMAAGGRYTFAGGTPAQRAEVRKALNASAFDWNQVPARITIHIGPGGGAHAAPGQIWIDANLLMSGRFAWATIQHEYAHQVDFFLLDAGSRALLNASLGGLDWCYGVRGLDHSDYGCERFASTLAWAYWPSPQNALRPDSETHEAAAMAPAPFRSLLGRLLGSFIAA